MNSAPTTPPPLNVGYSTYKSKRHSRTSSTITVNQRTSPDPRHSSRLEVDTPLSTNGIASTQTPPTNGRETPTTPPPGPTFIPKNGVAANPTNLSRSVSPFSNMEKAMIETIIIEPPLENGSTTDSETTSTALTSPTVTPDLSPPGLEESPKVVPPPLPPTNEPPATEPTPTITIEAVPFTSGPSSSSPVGLNRPELPRPSSTFRRIAPRSTLPHQGSPLRASSSPSTRFISLSPKPRPDSGAFSHPTTKVFGKSAHNIPAASPLSSSFAVPTIKSASGHAIQKPIEDIPTGLTSSISRNSSNTTKPPSLPITPSPAPASTPTPPPNLPLPTAPSTPVPPTTSNQGSRPRTPSTSATTPTTPGSKPSQAPYRPGFQPKPVYSHRTDEFIALRTSITEKKLSEEKRLLRRLEKLVELHFSPQSDLSKQRPTSDRRSSSIFDLSDFRGKSANEIWKGVVETSTVGKAEKLMRESEQRITHWQDDASVSACPICSSKFHPLTNRKHHCRLCGRVVCSLPAKPPSRPQTCSLLIRASTKTGRIDEVPEMVAYGVKRGGTEASQKEQEAHLKGVRICRDCNVTVQKQQFGLEASQAPPYQRHYLVMKQLESEIEEYLPAFQEMAFAISRSEERPPPEAANLRKTLLDDFAQYDAIAKRLRALPCPSGSSQDRVQAAIALRANLFLQQHMLPLKTIPAFTNQKKHARKKSRASMNTDSPKMSGASTPDDIRVLDAVDADSALALALQPLLEQEARLESFVEEAKAARKFEDAKTLNTNLDEIRAEIERIAKEGNSRATGRGRGR